MNNFTLGQPGKGVGFATFYPKTKVNIPNEIEMPTIDLLKDILKEGDYTNFDMNRILIKDNKAIGVIIHKNGEIVSYSIPFNEL